MRSGFVGETRLRIRPICIGRVTVVFGEESRPLHPHVECAEALIAGRRANTVPLRAATVPHALEETTMVPVFTLASSAIPSGARLVAFAGREAISELYRFEMDLVMSHAESEEFDMAAALGADATLTVTNEDGVSRASYHGVLEQVEFVHEFSGDAHYRVILVPRLWWLTKTHHSRIFVQKTVPEIIEAVLRLAGVASDDWELRLVRSYEPIEHVCMYRESYFDFLSRWMEREGIYYWFEQGDDREKLVIADARASSSARGDSVRFAPRTDNDIVEIEAMHSFACTHSSLPGRVQLRDYDYLRPDLAVEGHASVSSAASEINLFGENFTDANQGRRLANIRAQELQARHVTFEGVGHLFDLRPGYTFDLEGHPRSSFDQQYLTVELEHRGRRPGEATAKASEDGANESYRVRVRAIPSEVQFRAVRRAPTPRIYGTELGVIDGPLDHDFGQIDEHGRYLVKVLFDESEQRNGGASMRLRMLQPHGGNPEGFHFPLRKGTEVMLTFLGGDPDRPVIVGVVPNSLTPSPVTQSNHTLNVIHTGGGNRLEIQDIPGKEYIKFQTPHAKTMWHIGARHNPTAEKYSSTAGSSKSIVGIDQVAFVGHSRCAVIGEASENAGGASNLNASLQSFRDAVLNKFAEQTNKTLSDGTTNPNYDANAGTDPVDAEGANTDITVKDITEAPVPPGSDIKIVQADYWSKIGGERNAEVGGGQITLVHGDLSSEIDGSKVATVGGNYDSTVNGDRNNTVIGHKHVIVNGGQDSTVSGGQTSTINGGQTVTVNGGKTSTVNGTQTSTVNGAQTAITNGHKSTTVTGGSDSTITGGQMTSVTGGHVSTLTGGQIGLTDWKMNDVGFDMSATGVKISAVLLQLSDVVANFTLNTTINYAIYGAHVVFQGTHVNAAAAHVHT